MLKIGVTALVAACTLVSARGQFFSPEAWTGALFGSLIGGVAGSDCHHGFSGSGAAIGAGVGLLAGAAVGEANRRYYSTDPYVVYPSGTVYAQPGYGYVYAPVYTPVAPPPRPNYAVNGTLLGAMAGGLIGSANHHGWEGAGIGAASGLVLGSVAEAAARNSERSRGAVAVSPANVAPPPPAPARAAPTAPTRSWAVVGHRPQYQIPDAPRVPDAPTF